MIKQIFFKNQITSFLTILAVALLLNLLFSGDVMASSSQALPWDGPLDKLVKSLTGPVAMGISLIAIVVCGVALAFGGDMSGFARQMIMVVLAISVIMSAGQIMSIFFGSSGAVVTEDISTEHSQSLVLKQ